MAHAVCIGDGGGISKSSFVNSLGIFSLYSKVISTEFYSKKSGLC